MTNAYKYLKDGVDVEELTDKFNDWHLNNSNVTNYGEALYRFLQAEAKPTLTEDEKVILRNINKDIYTIIGFDTYGLYLKDDNTVSKEYSFYAMFSNLFQFIQERRRI